MVPAESGPTVPLIFIAEDDAGLMGLLRSRLERAGFRTATAGTGEEAVAWLSENRATLMVLDYQLADMIGEEVVARLETVGNLPPFVVVTGQGSEEVAVQMMKLGARDYLVKNARLLDVFPEVVKRVVRQIEQEQLLVQAESALRHSEYEHRTILESLPAGVLKVSATGELLFANSEARRFFRLGDKPLSARIVSQFQRNTVNEDLSSCPMRLHPLSQCLATRQSQSATTLGVRFHDGLISWAIFAATPIVSAAGDRLVAAVLSFVDITHRRQAEEALRLTFSDTESQLNGHLNQLKTTERKLRDEQQFAALLKETIQTERHLRRHWSASLPQAAAGNSDLIPAPPSEPPPIAAVPVPSEGQCLVRTLGWLVGRCAARTGMRLRFEPPPNFECPCPNTEALLLDLTDRLSAELAALPHVRQVDIFLGCLGEKMRLGFKVSRDDAEPVARQLAAVEELNPRIERLGGEVQIVGKTGGSFLVVLEVPQARALDTWSAELVATRPQPLPRDADPERKRAFQDESL